MIEIKEILEKSIQEIMVTANNSCGLIGLPSGFEALDKVLYGFDNSDLIVVGGRPAMGKTGFMLSVAINMAEQHIPVLFYSFEMSKTQVVKRIISIVTNIALDKIRSGGLGRQELDKLKKAMAVVCSYPIYINDSDKWSIEDFCKKVIEDVEKNNARVIFIDYLQLFSSSEKCQNRYEEIALCTRKLKRLAKELNLPIIVSSQLSRSVENRPSGLQYGKRPQMYDLRDSGTICDDANVVLLLHRPEYYLSANEVAEACDIRGLAEVSIAKNHMGRVDSIRLRFIPETGKFENWKIIKSGSLSIPDYDDIDTYDPPF